jgi:nucleotide-binding universal stress UspA family protein
MPMINRGLVAIDGSDHAARALDLVSEIAGRFEADLIAMQVVSDKALQNRVGASVPKEAARPDRER